MTVTTIDAVTMTRGETITTTGGIGLESVVTTMMTGLTGTEEIGMSKNSFLMMLTQFKEFCRVLSVDAVLAQLVEQ